MMKIAVMTLSLLISTQGVAQTVQSSNKMALDRAQWAERLAYENYVDAESNFKLSLTIAGVSLAGLIGAISATVTGAGTATGIVTKTVTAGGGAPYVFGGSAQFVNLSGSFTYFIFSQEPTDASNKLVDRAVGTTNDPQEQLAILNELRLRKVDLDHSRLLDGLTAGFLDYYEMKKVYTFAMAERKLLERQK